MTAPTVYADDRPIAQALRFMAAHDPDGARENNGVGFNKIDGQFGHSLAEQSRTRMLSDKQVAYAVKMLAKYRRQLEGNGFDVEAVLKAPEAPKGAKATARKRESRAVKVSTKYPGSIEIRFDYNQALVDTVKALPVRQFKNDETGKYWIVPENYITLVGRNFGPEAGFEWEPDVRKQLNAPQGEAGQLSLDQAPAPAPFGGVDARAVPGQIKATGARNTIGVKFTYRHPELIRMVKTLSGAHWNEKAVQWDVPADLFDQARELFSWFEVEPGLAEKIAAERAAEAARRAANKARAEAYLAATNGLTNPLPGNPAITLFEHQREAARFALEAGKALFAMDMGTGKTLSALAAAKAYADEGMEVIVVCPASLKTNWEREAEWAGVPVTVVSWHHNMIPAPPVWPYVVIADEVHRAKNPKAQRTVKFMNLVDHANCQSVMLLTGTPMVNGRPAELYTMLKALDHPLARNRRQYERRYCGAGVNQFGHYTANGADNLAELAEKTADVIYRKRKDQCLDLPEKMRVQYDIEISPEGQRIYDQALRQMRQKYEERKRDGKIRGADALAMLTFVRHAAALGTVPAVIEGAREILDAGHQVILFTNFKDVAAQLAEALGAEILSGDVPNEQRDPMVQRFQRGERRAMVMTYGAGGVGITLTAASYVYLVDRPWTPGECTQAEDRAHRIGQRNQVTVVWPQGFEVNRKIDALLLDKQDNIDNFLDGGEVDTLAAATTATAQRIALSVIGEVLGGR